jgi:hypothetical protein
MYKIRYYLVAASVTVSISFIASEVINLPIKLQSVGFNHGVAYNYGESLLDKRVDISNAAMNADLTDLAGLCDFNNLNERRLNRNANISEMNYFDANIDLDNSSGGDEIKVPLFANQGIERASTANIVDSLYTSEFTSNVSDTGKGNACLCSFAMVNSTGHNYGKHHYMDNWQEITLEEGDKEVSSRVLTVSRVYFTGKKSDNFLTVTDSKYFEELFKTKLNAGGFRLDSIKKVSFIKFSLNRFFPNKGYIGKDGQELYVTRKLEYWLDERSEVENYGNDDNIISPLPRDLEVEWDFNFRMWCSSR